MKTRVCYIISQIDRVLAFEWICENIDRKRFELFFILLNPKPGYMESFLDERNIPYTSLKFTGKASYPRLLFQLLGHLKKIRPHIIHAHFLDANLLGMTAAKMAGIKKRIYTRHHSFFHHFYHPHGVGYDRYTNFLATKIVAISPVVQQVLIEKENVDLSKIKLIPHGLQLKDFKNIDRARIQTLQQKYNLEGRYPVVGVIARYSLFKGYLSIIEAFKKILKDYPKACLLVANAVGSEKDQIYAALKELPEDSFKEILFERDSAALYRLFDVYVHVPVNAVIEAFGLTYVEALASGIPSVFTLSGIAHEFICHKQNAWVVDYENSDQIYEGVKQILENDSLRNHLIEKGKLAVKPFDLSNYISALETLYEQA